jgi:2-dehydro-3-deoxygluconokinase
MLWHDGQAYFSKTYSIHIVNRVGGGDSFSGGLIYGLRQNLGLQNALEFATAASCLKHSIEMDYNLVSVDQVMTLMNGDGSGRVQR